MLDSDDLLASNWTEEEKRSARERAQKEKEKNRKAEKKSKGVDYYAILNVSRDATNERIRAAYKALAVAYHPDTHSASGDADLVAEAKEKFTLIKTAYETLIDEKKRTLYDLYGAEGVQAGWELATKYQTIEEMLKAYQKEERLAEEMREEAVLDRKSSIKMQIDASNIKNALTGEYSLPEILAMNISQSVKWPLNEMDYVTIEGQVNAANGNGYGMSMFSLFKSLSPESKCFSRIVTGTDRMMLILGAWRRISRGCEATVHSNIQLGGIATVLSVSRQLSEKYSSSLSWSVGAFPGLTMGLQRVSESTEAAADLQVEGETLVGSVKVKKAFSKHTTMEVQVSTAGKVELATDRKVSKHSTVGVAVSVMAESLYLSMRIQRGGQKLSCPILLSSEVSLYNVFGAFCIKALFLLILKHLIIEPRKRRRKQRKLEQLRRETAEATAKARQNAESSIKLMANTVSRKRAMEEAKAGLIIIQGWYGNLLKGEPETIKDAEFPLVIDVTIPLQFHVESSELHLQAGSKSNLLGFYDPCPGEDKQLFIQYLFKDKLHEVTIEDSDSLSIPRQRDLKQL